MAPEDATTLWTLRREERELVCHANAERIFHIAA